LAGSLAGNALARKNPRIHLAERIHQEEQGLVEGVTDASAAFRATGRPVEELYAEASDIKERFVLASKLSGAWIGLVAGLKLIGLAMYRRRPDYEADRLLCVGCARCYSYCPQELQRRGIPVAPVEPA
jgi:ferredoxin